MQTPLQSKPLSSRQEDYLEAIHSLDRGEGVRPSDLAEAMKVRKPSVTALLRTLSVQGWVSHARYGRVTLTAQGTQAAREIVDRHSALRDFLEKVLFVQDHEADAVACRMEHELPARVLKKIRMFLDFIENCPYGGKGFIESFRDHCSKTGVGRACQKCDRARHPPCARKEIPAP